MLPPYRKKKLEKTRELTPSERVSLNTLFYSPRTGFSSSAKIFKKAKYIPALAHVTESQVKSWAREQPVNETHFPRRKPMDGYATITADGPGSHMQMDFLIYLNHPKKGYKYILCLIDVYSRYAAVRATKDREGPTYTAAFKDMIEKDFGWVYPKHLNSDQEFIYEGFKNLMVEKNITQHLSETDEERKNSIVERFIRTLRMLLEKHRWATDDLDWPAVLPEIIYNYNNRYHSTIKSTPFKVMNQIEPNRQTIRRVFSHFQKGDRVRILKLKKTFQKGEVSTLSDEVYILEEKEAGKWVLRNMKTGQLYPSPMKEKNLKHADAIPQPSEEKEQEHPEELPALSETHAAAKEERKEVRRRRRADDLEITSGPLRKEAKRRRGE